MVGGYHSDSSDSGDSTSTVQHARNPFEPLQRPAAARTYLSPGHRQLRPRNVQSHTPIRHHHYSTPGRPTRPEAVAQSAANEDEEIFVPTMAEAQAGEPGIYTRERVLVSAVSVLHRALNALPALVVKTKPSINSAAFRQGIHQRQLEVVDWRDLRSYDDPTEFLDVLFKHYRDDEPVARSLRGSSEDRSVSPGHSDIEMLEAGSPSSQSNSQVSRSDASVGEHLLVSGLRTVPYFPQIVRFLSNEANASEAFLSNALNPVEAVVQQFIPSGYRPTQPSWHAPEGPGLKIICSGQHPLPGESDESASALDLTFALVSWPPNYRPALRFDLVICELKRPGYVKREHWSGEHFRPGHTARKPMHEHPQALLPQLMLYNHRSGCERFLFSDYLETVAVHVEHASMVDPKKGPVMVGAQPVSMTKGRPRSPYEGGVGVAVAYEIAQALKALGCANKHLFENGFRDPNGTKHAIPLHRDIVDFLNTRPEEKAEHSPARGRRDSVVG